MAASLTNAQMEVRPSPIDRQVAIKERDRSRFIRRSEFVCCSLDQRAEGNVAPVTGEKVPQECVEHFLGWVQSPYLQRAPSWLFDNASIRAGARWLHVSHHHLGLVEGDQVVGVESFGHYFST